MAAQLTATKGPLLKALALCMLCAKSSLPVPVSPKIKMGRSVFAACFALPCMLCAKSSLPVPVSPKIKMGRSVFAACFASSIVFFSSLFSQ
jgi:hypothetical protein